MLQLIIMQGVPGSGKTTLAKKLAKQYNAVVYSADDFFIIDGEYKFDFTKLQENHTKNYERTVEALSQGKSVIVDNQNIQRWECKPYVQFAVLNKISIKFVRAEGNYQNTHNVPEEIVARKRGMLEELTVESVLKSVKPVRVENQMTRNKVKQTIQQVITEKQGCKATELPVEVQLRLGKESLDHPIPELAEELVQEKEVVEIEYVLPAMNYRIKSWYLPKGTQVNVKNAPQLLNK